MLFRSPAVRLGKKIQKQIAEFQKRIVHFKAALEAICEHENFLEYCETVLSRKGLVNFLYEQVCGTLNQSARDYAEMFTGSVIQLRFSPITQRKSGEIVNEFSIEVVNTQGGESKTDQSRGEEQLAALMCVLCLRDIGPRSNLLILDEPTEGLDAVNSRRFADGLNGLQKKFPCILLATHNPDIKARFSEERQIRVVKKNRVAEVC